MLFLKSFYFFGDIVQHKTMEHWWTYCNEKSYAQSSRIKSVFSFVLNPSNLLDQ